MAALSTNVVGDVASVALAAASGGGDTITGGPSAGGWDMSFLVANVGGTATTITVDGVARGPFTSVLAVIPVRRYNGSSVAITYSQVTGVTVGSFRLGGSTQISFGT
jgi:hypothetical protein